MSKADTEKVRRLNDCLRARHAGGRLLVSVGVRSLGHVKIYDLLRAIASFDDFTAANDPWSEHDCACIDFDGQTFIWKIDYYDETLTLASPDPADPNLTARVMIVMLASEY